MPQQEDTVIDPVQAQGSKKKKKNKKKKKKAIASTDPSFAPDESTAPPATPSAIIEQEEMLNKESLDWLDGVVQSDTKPAGKKSKSKKKATAAVATAEASANVATGQPFEQAGFKASQAHFDDERNYVAQVPVNVGDSLEPSHNEYDIHGRQVLYAVAASGNDDLSFLNNDFMNTATSNWADDIDEYEQNHIPPNSIATAAPPATSAASLSTSAQQTPWKDSAPRNLVYKGPIVTQVGTAQSQDARFSSAPDTRRSYAWVSRQGSHDDQGPAESKHKPGVERNKNATTSAALAASLQISGEPKNKRATGPGMDTTTLPQPPSHASQKNKHKKQEQRRSFSLSTQSQEKSQSLTPMQMKFQAHVEPPDQQLLAESDSEQLQHLQHLLFYDALPPLEGVKDFELPWLASSKPKSGPEPWADRNKVIEFFSKRWVEARMSSGGQGPDAAVVYYSSP
ncbi:hypothetical protein EC957_000318 [Mortierella hygrophila]|uniref:Uncharacterized protein n=1 Tax=Mortierella hygrophila TaxID=979708 RepID=A0A9P6F774_9FUNG|nr:hypothetical protein EC957_000318 [Mortierella hygrophila]